MGGKTATSTSQTTIPPEVLARYNAVNTMAQNAASKPYQSFGTQASDYIAQMNQQQNTGIAGVNAAAGSYKPYLDSATSATQAGMGSSIDNIQKYMSPYLTNVADTTSALMRQSNEQAQSGALGAAASSGAFGGDRAGIAAANLAGQNQLAMGKTMADIYNQGYGQAASLSQADLARQLQGGAQMAGLGAQAQGLGLQGAQAQLASGTMQQQTEQAGKDAMINRFMQEQGYPFQTAQFLANIALGTGVASGTTTTSERPVGFFQNLATGGRANGYADGGGVAGPMQHSQSNVGSQGYVPAGVLPVGDLMVAQIPQDEQRSGLEDVMKIASMFMGSKAHGGAAVGRHGYQTDGAVREEPGLVNSLTRMARDSGQFISDMLPDNPRPQEAPIGPNRPVSPGLAGNLAMAGSAAGRLLAGSRDTAPTVGSGVGGGGADRMPVTSAATGLGGLGTPPPVVTSTTERPSITLPGLSGATTGMEAPPVFPSPPDAGLSPMTSIRPMPRPAGLAGAPTAVDLAAAGIGAIPVNETTAYGVGAKSVPDVRPAVSSSPRADTGERLESGYTPIIPLIPQLNFTLHELGKPEYNGYLQGNFRTPSEAAVAFDRIYERSGGAGNKAAASYAEGIHAAAMSGDMSGLPPNVVTSYNHFVENGMDPIQAAGAVGRFMVESYPSLNENARNTMGGGNGTYGIAQWRGSRMEELAEFAGVPLEALTGAPVSTPEGRYYSTGTANGDGVSGLAGGAGQTQPGGLGGNQKAYEDRNALGKFFHTPDGKLNKDAVMSIMAGLGAMASSTSMSPLTALLQGAGAGAGTYSQLEQRRGEISKQGIANTSDLVKLYNDFTFSNPQYSNMGIEDFARAQGVEHLLPQITGQGAMTTPLSAINPVTLQEARGYVDAGNGVQIPFMNDYASLNRVFNDYSAAPEGSRQRALADQARLKMAEIEATGYTTGIGPNGEAVNIPVDAVREKIGGMGTDAANVETTQIFRDEAQKRLPAIGGDVDRVDRQIDIYTSVPAGAWTEEKARLGAIASTLGLEGIGGLLEGDQIAKIEEAIKEKAIGIASRGGTDGMTDYERQFISQSTATPNLQPEAIKKLLAIEKATLLREEAMLAGHSQWMSTASNPYDLNAYKAEFADQNPISKYIKAVEAEMPTFAGEAIQKPSDVSDAAWSVMTDEEKRVVAGVN